MYKRMKQFFYIEAWTISLPILLFFSVVRDVEVGHVKSFVEDNGAMGSSYFSFQKFY